MVRFVLIHGAYHGPWCWDRLVPELEDLGHEALAVDLPIGDPSAGADRYAGVAVEAIRVSGWDVGNPASVVVAHSMSGLMAPLVAERVRISMLVFLCAFIPRPGSSLDQQRQNEAIEPAVDLTDPQFEDLGDGVRMIGPDTATRLFFHDAPPDLAAWAADRLRPQALRVMAEVSPLTSWPDVPTAYVLCRDDRAVSAEWAREGAQQWLGVEAIEMGGGHSPFLTRPAELAAVLDGLVRREPGSSPLG